MSSKSSQKQQEIPLKLQLKLLRLRGTNKAAMRMAWDAVPSHVLSLHTTAQWPERKSFWAVDSKQIPCWDPETPVRMFNKAQEMRKNCMNPEQKRAREQ